ncbi:phosphate ABC transporter permease PstA [Polymorphospora rubra]|uniref:phosphate ABC transporter permease PstA n=1 Tax=Polymorphospora rubra TaxID=338584 RepID=UPI0033DFF47C
MSTVDQLTPVKPAAAPAAAPSTTLPAAEPGPDLPEVRRATGQLRRTDGFAMIGALVAAVSLTALLFTRLAPFDGLLGFVVVSYLAFLGFYTLLVSFDENGPTVQDRLAAAVVHSLASLMLLALVAVVAFTLWRGRDALGYLNFFVEDMGRAGPLQPLSVGGIRHAMVGTLQQIAIALAVTVPLGLVCAVFLSELPGPFSRLVRTIAEAMTALPSVVAGLFIYATVVLALGLDKSGFAASLALGVMMLPIMIRAADVVIRLVPGTLREASLALGASQWRTIWHVVVPTARSGLTTAVILGTARGIGETSPVLLTAGFAAYTNVNPTSGPQTSLPLFVFDAVRRPDEAMISRGFGAAAVLMGLVLILFVIARLVGGRAPGQLGRRAARARVRASRRDAVRFAARARARQVPGVEASDSEVSDA